MDMYVILQQAAGGLGRSHWKLEAIGEPDVLMLGLKDSVCRIDATSIVRTRMQISRSME
jgi:hypothetical protein